MLLPLPLLIESWQIMWCRQKSVLPYTAGMHSLKFGLPTHPSIHLTTTNQPTECSNSLTLKQTNQRWVQEVNEEQGQANTLPTVSRIETKSGNKKVKSLLFFLFFSPFNLCFAIPHKCNFLLLLFANWKKKRERGRKVTSTSTQCGVLLLSRQGLVYSDSKESQKGTPLDSIDDDDHHRMNWYKNQIPQ